MRFSILGPLSVDIDGEPINITRPRWRSILAYLLLQANRPVTTSRLVTAIWGDHPVPTANTQVHTAVSVLRRTFRRADPAEVIANPPTGYLINLEEKQLDVLGFTATVSTARVGTDTPDDLRRALDLWRGPALEGITAAFADAARARLEEERLFLFERLMDLEIDRGNTRDITPEIMGFIDRHPLRESLVERLMLALYRSGRKSDALREYARIRERLSTELGVEPGPDLRRLHLEMLQDGPTVRHRAPERDRARPAHQPRRLPRPSPAFTGRAAERTQLRYALTRRPDERTVVSLHGAAGVGKSAVAIQTAHDLGGDFPDGQLYIDLLGSSPGPAPDRLGVLRLALHGMGLAESDIPSDESEAAQRFQQLAADARLLILLDNAAGPHQVSDILRMVRRGAVIITSRAPLEPPDSDLQLRIDVLPPADATALLDRIAGRAGADWSQFNRITAYCDYLPLALCIAGGRLARHPDLTGAGLTRELTTQRDRLDALDMDGVGVSSSIKVGYDPIAHGNGPVDRVAATAFHALGILPVSSLDVAVVSAMSCPDDPTLAAAALNRLARAQLVTGDEEGRYRPHSLVRAAAAEYAAESLTVPQRDELVGRAIAFYTACAVRAEDLLRPHRQPESRPEPVDPVSSEVLDLVLRSGDDVGGWLDSYLPDLVSVAAMAAKSPASARHAIGMAEALSWILRHRGDFRREHVLARNAVRAADRLADPVVVRRTLIRLGRVELYLGRQSVADKHFERALASARTDGDVHSQIAVLNDLSLAAINRGELSTAKRLLGECVGLATPLTARIDVTAATRHNLAVVEALLNRWQAASRLLHEAIGLRTSADPAAEGSDRVLLGVVYCAMGRLDDAVDQLSVATDTCEGHGDLVDAWFGLTALTVAHLRQNRDATAAATGRRCLLLARSIGQPFAEKSAHHLLALALAATGESEGARSHRRRSEAIDAAPVTPDTRLIAALLVG